MATEVATAVVSIIPSARGFSGNLSRQLDGEAATAGKKAGATAGKHFGSGILAGVKNIAGPLAAVAAGVGIKNFLSGALDEARESQKVGAMTTAVIKSTGAAANVTSKQVGNLSSALSKKVGIDDEVIQSAANMMLRFQGVRNEVGKGNDVFNQSIKVATDMSAALGTSAPSAAKMLGRALNDPVKGLSALTRVGVSFTDQQKKQIERMVESGKVSKAQGVILDQLRAKFGGTAAAQATAGDKATVAWANFKEMIGTALLPVVDKLLNFVTTQLIPGATTLFNNIQNGTGISGKLAEALGAVFRAGMKVVKFFHDNSTATKVLFGLLVTLVGIERTHAAVMGIQAAGGLLKYLRATKLVSAATRVYTAVQWALNAAMSANPIGLVVAALVGLGFAVVIAWKKSETFRKIVTAAWDGIKNAAQFAWDKVLHPVFNWLIDFITHKVPEAFHRGVDAISGFWNKLKSIASKPVEFLVNTVYNNGIKKVVDAIPGFGDLPEVHFSAFAQGGPVRGGIRGKDSVPALMMPGEHVLTEEEVRNAGGHKAILRLRELMRKKHLGKVADLGEALPKFASGGFLKPEDLERAMAFARMQVGKPYIWGGVGPGGYDCSGFMSAITNVLLNQYPYSRRGTSSSFPWPGFKPGWGQFTVGAFTGDPGHVAGTLAGVNVESTDGYVRMGSAARGAGDPMFTRIGHLGESGSKYATASGGFGFMDAIKAVKSFVGKVGGLFSELTNMGGWGGLMKGLAKEILNKIGGKINDLIPNWGPIPDNPFPTFDRGGIMNGFGVNRSGRPERVLSPRQTRDFERLSKAMAGQGRMSIVIENWDTGKGYMRSLARDEVSAESEFVASRRRAGSAA